MYYDCHSHHTAHAADTLSILNVRYGGSTASQIPPPFSVGLHPWDCLAASVDNGFRSLAQQAMAIGECGLDRACSAPMDLQTSTFEEQIGIAQQLHKPMIVHCVRCYSELLQLSRKHPDHTPWILHAYYASPELTKAFLSENVFFSFGLRELRRPKVQPLAAIIPIDRILAESDEESISMAQIIDLFDSLYNISGDDMMNTIEHNFRRVFPLPSR